MITRILNFTIALSALLLASAVVMLLLYAAPASADEPARKIDFAKVLTGPSGPFKECRRADTTNPQKCADEIDLTLGGICLTAAAMPDKGASPADQISHGRLAFKLLEVLSRPGTKEEALSIDDIKFLKDQIPKLGYSTMAVYQATQMLDPTVDKP